MLTRNITDLSSGSVSTVSHRSCSRRSSVGGRWGLPRVVPCRGCVRSVGCCLARDGGSCPSARGGLLSAGVSRDGVVPNSLASLDWIRSGVGLAAPRTETTPRTTSHYLNKLMLVYIQLYHSWLAPLLKRKQLYEEPEESQVLCVFAFLTRYIFLLYKNGSNPIHQYRLKTDFSGLLRSTKRFRLYNRNWEKKTYKDYSLENNNWIEIDG